MPAYAVFIPNLKCHCGKKATVAVYTGQNGHIGNFCAECGARKVRELNGTA